MMVRDTCRQHRRALAGWSCDGCQAKLCPDCVAEKHIDALCVEVCGTCNERVARIVEHRAHTSSYRDRLRTIWRYPLSLGGIAAIFVIGFLFGLGSLSPLYLALALAVFWACIFTLIQMSARGIDDIDPPDFSSLFESIVQVLFRALIATSASWVPLIVYLWSVKPSLVDALVDPIVWLLIVFALLIAPMAIMGAAVKTSLLKLLNPIWTVRCVALLGEEYWVAVGVLGLLVLVQGLIAFLGSFILRIPVPIVPAAIVGTMLSYVPFLMARVVGLLIYVHGDKLGYGDENDYYERVLHEKPRGVLAEKNVLGLETPTETKPVSKAGAIEVDF